MSFPHADRSLLALARLFHTGCTTRVGGWWRHVSCQLHRNELFTSAAAPVSYFSHCSHCRPSYFILFWSVNSRSEFFHDSHSRLFLYLVRVSPISQRFRNAQTHHQAIQSLNGCLLRVPTIKVRHDEIAALVCHSLFRNRKSLLAPAGIGWFT